MARQSSQTAIFDPYYVWLGIAPEHRPPNFYRLLNIPEGESSAEVIENGYNRQMGFLRAIKDGEHLDAAEKLKGEIARARLDLLDPAKKSAYDARLKPERAAERETKFEAEVQQRLDQRIAAERTNLQAALTTLDAELVAAEKAQKELVAALSSEPDLGEIEAMLEPRRKRLAEEEANWQSRLRRVLWMAPTVAAVGLFVVCLLGWSISRRGSDVRYGTASVDVAQPPPDAQFKLDGKPIELAALGKALRLPVGHHHLLATGPKSEPFSTTFEVRTDDPTQVTVRWQPRPELGRLLVALDNPPAALRLQIDSKSLPLAEFQDSVALPPGEYSLLATSPSTEPILEAFTIHAAERTMLRLTWEKSPDSSSSVAPPTPAPQTVPPSSPVTPVANSSRLASTEVAGSSLVGRLVTEQQVLARTGDAALFYRLPDDAPLSAGERLFTPPNFQPQIRLVSGVKLRLVGPAMLTTTMIPELGVPGFTLEYGRAVIGTDAGGARFVVQLGARAAIVTFSGPDAVIALEATRFRPPGADPEATVASAVVHVYVLQGRIAWRESETAVETITAGSEFAFVDKHPPQVFSFGDAPKWAVAQANPNVIDQHAAKDLEPLLVSRDVQDPKPLKLMLQELIDHRRVELASLAICSLSYLDDFNKVNTFFNDVRYKSYWRAYFDCLQDSLTRGPEPAAALRGQLEQDRGVAGKHLYDLLVGFSPEQLQRAGAKVLVGDLQHNSMDHRVFAIESLYRITGKTLLYRPLNEPKREISAINEWKKLLNSNSIVYKSPPTALPARNANQPQPTP